MNKKEKLTLLRSTVKMDVPAELATLKAKLKERKVKQRDFARALGVSEDQLSHWFRGYRTPLPTTMLAMKLVFDIHFKN
jgi:transcriptional regulator with XRE-family HTH domain